MPNWRGPSKGLGKKGKVRSQQIKKSLSSTNPREQSLPLKKDYNKIHSEEDEVKTQANDKIKIGKMILLDRISFLKNAFKFNENDLRKIENIETEKDYAEYALHNILPQVLKLRESGFFDKKTVAHMQKLYQKYLEILAKPKRNSFESDAERKVNGYKKSMAEMERQIAYLTDLNEKLTDQIAALKRLKNENLDSQEEISTLQGKLQGLEVILNNLVEDNPDQQKILEINKQLLDENFKIKKLLQSQQKEVDSLYDGNMAPNEATDELLEKLKNNSKLYDRYFEADNAKNFAFKNGKSFENEIDEMEMRLSEIGDLNKLMDYRQFVIDQLKKSESVEYKDDLFHKLEKENDQLVNLIEASKRVVDSVIDDEAGGVKPLKVMLDLQNVNSELQRELANLKAENDKLINRNNQLLRENQDTMAMYNKFKSKMSDYENSLRFFEKNEKEYFELKRELASEKQKGAAYKNQYDNLNRKYTKILNRYQELIHEYDNLFTQFGVRN
jgi:hypothetical protein